MRFHVLGLPHTVSSKEYLACAYTQKVVKFGQMMTDRGHTVIHYGHEESNLTCTEHVTVLSTADWKKTYGDHDWRKHFFKYDMNDNAYQTFFKNAIYEVGLRKRKNDFILPFWGSGTRPICDAHPDLICVEPGIGYAGGHWAKYKIFESYAIYHAFCGMTGVGCSNQNWYEAVIPNYFDVSDFTFRDRDEKEDYFLFLGRVCPGKGLNVAIQVTEAIGAKLIIAGQGSLESLGYDTVPAHVTHYGYADVEARKELMSKAKGAFVASMYVEPFGGVQVECLLSGTPTITTDWGAFTENNIHGVTGYRCRTFDQFCWAARNISRIDPKACRDFASKNFCLEKVATMYEEYFDGVLNIHTRGGWYEPSTKRPELSWLGKHYPSAPAMESRAIGARYYEPVLEEEEEVMVVRNPILDSFVAVENEQGACARRLAEWLVDFGGFQPTKVEVGANIGIIPGAVYAHALKQVGVQMAIWDPVDVAMKQQDGSQCNLVLCLEAFNTFSPEHNQAVVDHITKSMRPGCTLIWSSSQPGAKETNYINLFSKQHWVDMFVKAGLKHCVQTQKRLTDYLVEGTHMGWFAQNVLIFQNHNLPAI